MSHQEDIWLSQRINTDAELVGGFDPQGIGDADDNPVGWLRVILDTDIEPVDDSLFAAVQVVDPKALDQEAAGFGG